ncbi:MAG: 23S rRNA (pseudouridine(1915)-N(3))-methyltransferase RlmH [Ruminococcaceae bacterium]|nr:23S rRNA (pseudouridine(1915)-N(3))-methyltransferase RlmH [Oscillospiraceae bacterium]
MKIKIISLGGTTEKGYEALCTEYYKRLGNGTVEIRDLKPEPLSADPSQTEIKNALEKEADRILAEIPRQYYVFAMCVEGKQPSSEELAEMLENAALSGKSGAAFIIGSSYGLSDRVKKAADYRMSLSRLTLPHKLARLVLSEAIYRAFEINKGSRYHK